MSASRAERVYEKRAWILLFAIGILGLVTSIPPLFGVDPDPARIEGIIGMSMDELAASNPEFLDLIVFLLGAYGLVNLVWSILVIAISMTAYKQGKRWAWYAFWSLPAYFIGSAAILSRFGLTSIELVLLPLLVVLSISGLLLPIRKFFPKELNST
jgi:hypothetical protein